ncbi:MAG: HNH endonuclease [Thermomicrobiales bacterium]
MEVSQDRLFRSFKKHYHDTEGALLDLLAGGAPTLNLKFDKSGMSIANSIQNEESLVRFLVQAHHFLNPSDSLYLNGVWLAIQKSKELLTKELIEEIETGFEQLDQSLFKLSIAGETYSSKRMYELVAGGEFFSQIEENAALLQEIGEIAPILRHQFYERAMSSMRVAFSLFSAIREIAKNNNAGDESTTQHKKCIYCFSVDGSFASEEHIFPEALGNHDLKLPQGYVCDRCNNGILADLDKKLVKFEPIAFLHVFHVTHKKKGKLPEATFQNATLKATRPTHIVVESAAPVFKEVEVLGNGYRRFEFNLRGRRFEPRQLARSLFKIGYELLALEHGQDFVCQERFAATRRFILRGGNFSNSLILRTKMIPHPQLRACSYATAEGSLCMVDIFGIAAFFSLEEMPIIALNEFLQKADFESFLLHK